MSYEYTVIGGGPAGIIAVVRILEKLLTSAPDIVATRALAKKVCWVDESFAVGAFGRQWKNVPGNTAANKYWKVYREMFAVLKKYGISLPDESEFALFSEDPDYPSFLKTAAVSLQWMTAQLVKLVTPIRGRALMLDSTERGIQIFVRVSIEDAIRESARQKYMVIEVAGKKHALQERFSKRCILAIGGAPKILDLPPEHIYKHLPLEIVLDIDLLREFVAKNPDILKSMVLVQGSSHSAALAVWNLLACGVKVKQIMNKPYLYYSQSKGADGILRVYHENDGLKGKVAQFTRELQAGRVYTEQWSYEIIPHGKVEDYSPYKHIVSAIGLGPANTLTVAGVPSSELRYDPHTTETQVQGIFAIGVGYPSAAQDGSKNIGISKFWLDIGKAVVHWYDKPAKVKAFDAYHKFHAWKVEAFNECQRFNIMPAEQSPMGNSEQLSLVARL